MSYCCGHGRREVPVGGHSGVTGVWLGQPLCPGRKQVWGKDSRCHSECVPMFKCIRFRLTDSDKPGEIILWYLTRQIFVVLI